MKLLANPSLYDSFIQVQTTLASSMGSQPDIIFATKLKNAKKECELTFSKILSVDGDKIIAKVYLVLLGYVYIYTTIFTILIHFLELIKVQVRTSMAINQ